jgi:hypothetical protein
MPSAWISVKERRPKPWADCLTISPAKDQRVLFMTDDGMWRNPCGGPIEEYEVTHWQPLPEPPKNE